MVEFETNQILDNLPVIALISVIIITYVPQVPSFIKLPVLLVGITGSIAVSFVTEKLLQYEASAFLALKCNIYPLNKTVTFFIKNKTQSKIIDASNDIYSTGPLILATKVPFQIFGKVEAITIEHKKTWSDRVEPDNGVVIYKGVQIKHKSVALLTLFLNPNDGLDVNMLEVRPTFKLYAGPQDYWLLKNKFTEIGESEFQ